MRAWGGGTPRTCGRGCTSREARQWGIAQPGTASREARQWGIAQSGTARRSGGPWAWERAACVHVNIREEAAHPPVAPPSTLQRRYPGGRGRERQRPDARAAPANSRTATDSLGGGGAPAGPGACMSMYCRNAEVAREWRGGGYAHSTYYIEKKGSREVKAQGQAANKAPASRA